MTEPFDQEPTPEEVAEMREEFFGILDNDDMEVIATQVIALSATIRNKAAEFYGRQVAEKLHYEREATDLYIAFLHEKLSITEGASE